MTDRSTTTRAGEKQTDPHQTFSAQLTPLFLLTSIFFVNFLARIVLAPLMPSVEYDLNMNHAEAGSLFLSISLGYFISLIGSGFISSHLTHKQTIILSATTLGLVLIFTAFSPGLWTMRLGVFMVGIAAPTFIGFMGDVNSYGTGIALAGGAVFMGSFITGYLRFQDRSDTG